MERAAAGELEPWSEVDDLEAAIRARIERGAVRVPPYPSVALALRNLMGKDNYGLDEVLGLVSTDAALVADVLRCANAAFFGRGTVSSLQQAVGRVGATQVMRLALVSGLSGLVRTSGPLAPLRRQAWVQSLASAALCQTLAPMRKLAAESAFVAGLLHDFGWLIGIAAVEEMLAQIPTATPRSEKFWNDAIDRCHTKLGLALASRWNLPELLRDVIGLHHTLEAPTVFLPFVELTATIDRVLELLQAESLVSAEMLAQVPGLKPAEREALALAIPQLPELVSAFDSEPQGNAHPKPLIQHAPLPEGFAPLDCQVRQLSPRKRGPFAMIGIATNSLLMKGRDALPEKQLVELELGIKSNPLRLWTKVEQCVPEPGGFKVQCRPFALIGPALQQWRDLGK